jgi:sRNA-binding carbon storage regulator CsrA
MLVITRKKDERIRITTESGEQIIITIPEIKSATSERSAKVRLGFEADRAIRIDREENLSEKLKMKLVSGELV